MDRRKETNPTNIASSVSTNSDTTLQRNQRLLQEYMPASALPASPAPNRNDGHVRLFERGELGNGVAVVDNGQPNHHRHPQSETIQRDGRVPPGCAARLKVNSSTVTLAFLRAVARM